MLRMNSSCQIDRAQAEWLELRQSLATTLHRLAMAYGKGSHFTDALRAYRHELLLRESAGQDKAAEITHCLWCVARLCDRLDNKGEADHFRSRARLGSERLLMPDCGSDTFNSHRGSICAVARVT